MYEFTKADFDEVDQIDILEHMVFGGNEKLVDYKNVKETAFKGGKIRNFELSEDEIIQEGLL